ncbi:Asp23/Gls24 family envelope stress response protein [Pseudoflavonifractor phocaeensis]|uniref:Asp23/Gls24 family envelope stress response protein n=1 Tax=Pseudoflavonifractor phocaeensis TaxID=1870988 RepID=UPI00195D7F8D|nr:Asp23/Gls24 family envelope stress response protein [Pseudoflavonifractor phocaeensis]MBM6869835.1 Asp23/Gls24 family envelope stress response protein [Pseudoflavonifractor phocaeensis]MBM6938077.1 Asp23/Gls24 family envelope stress response protein [Pseudoflavonifractor phocaeensis]
MKLQSDKGEIRISSEVFTNITGAAAINCYGVKGMAIRSKTDGLVHLLRRESMSKGVKVTYNEDSTVSIELHIIVDNGVNLMAVSRSIMNEVRYNVSRITGVEVKNVDVYVDSMVIG